MDAQQVRIGAKLQAEITSIAKGTQTRGERRRGAPRKQKRNNRRRYSSLSPHSPSTVLLSMVSSTHCLPWPRNIKRKIPEIDS